MWSSRSSVFALQDFKTGFIFTHLLRGCYGNEHVMGMVIGVGRRMGVLDGGGDLEGKGQFWGEFGVSYCN